MSGIVGIVHLDGRPVDPRLLKRMTNYLAFRGPDAQEIWIDGNVGFGHTMLRTTWESEHEHQPHTLDGQVWITADARIDDRQNLVEKLAAKGRNASIGRPDVELILHAYHAWGEDCVEHLLGDFAFAIWDSRSHRLFCARDQLGIKPFYFCRSQWSFIFSNTLTCVRQHYDVTAKLNDFAIAQFLLFERNQDLTTTAFADIQTIPPAHTVIVDSSRFRARRYWLLPIDKPIYYKNKSEYLEHFNELLFTAVRNRMRTPWVGVSMSGGLDSTILAAVVCEFTCDSRQSVEAFTTIFDGLVPDRERYYSGLAASHLDIPIRYRILDNEMLSTPWTDFWGSTPEPRCGWPPRIGDLNYYRELSNRGRVFFYGEGPDNALRYEWNAYCGYLARRGSWGRLISDIFCHSIAHRRVPLIPSLPRIVMELKSNEAARSPFPNWISDEFVSRLDLRALWKNTVLSRISNHPIHPRGYASFVTPLWQEFFNSCDPESTEVPIEFRHPYLDLRLLRYMLSVPIVPWCRRKYLLRQASVGLLPEEVLRRPKTPVAGDPLFETLRYREVPPFKPMPQIYEYVNPAKIEFSARETSHDCLGKLRALALNNWLENLEEAKCKWDRRQNL
jgi:asparagine synthase (glutamine-hydrolysing)